MRFSYANPNHNIASNRRFRAGSPGMDQFDEEGLIMKSWNNPKFEAYTKAQKACHKHAKHCHRCYIPIIDEEGNPGYPSEACAIGSELLKNYMKCEDELNWKGIMKIICSKCGTEIEINPAAILGHSAKGIISTRKTESSRLNIEKARFARKLKQETIQRFKEQFEVWICTRFLLISYGLLTWSEIMNLSIFSHPDQCITLH
jgi:hypothetical protein